LQLHRAFCLKPVHEGVEPTGVDAPRLLALALGDEAKLGVGEGVIAPFGSVGGLRDGERVGVPERIEAAPKPAAIVRPLPARLRAIEADDLPAIWRFCLLHYQVYRGLRWDDFKDVWDHRWRLNPAWTPEHPLGWLVENPAAEIVGFGAYVPMPLKIGATSVTAVCTANWVVSPAYRHHSLAMFRK
jgi:hypothetical protein